MKRKPLAIARTLMLSTPLCLPLFAQADLQDLVGSFSTELENSTALSAQATYDNLLINGCADVDIVATATCAGTTFAVFENLRELVHTANELTGNGATRFGLGTDLRALGFALRWTAGEEFAAQGSMTGDFVNGQLANLTSRLAALRLGAAGFSVGSVSNYGDSSQRMASANRAILGGGASGDEGFEQYSPWGGFMNVSYGYGDKTATDFEDAFDFDGYQINGGLDYRLNQQWVIGAVLAYTDQTIDFDSSQSIVEGGVESDGFSVMPFILIQEDSWFWSFSVGYQQMALSTDRAIRYTSLNPNVSNTDTRTVSSTDASTVSMFTSIGYTFRRGRFSFEPYVEYETLSIAIDGFTERDINNSSFDLRVADQDVDSTEIAFGASMNFTLTPSFGVFVPQIDVQRRSQQDDESRSIGTSYSGTDLSSNLNVVTDELDSDYYVTTFGVSSVLRGGRQRAADGAISGGLQGFINYKVISNLENYTHRVITAGMRYEF